MSAENLKPTQAESQPRMNGEVAVFPDGSRVQVFNEPGETIGSLNKYYPTTDSVNSAIIRLTSPDGRTERVGISKGVAVMLPEIVDGRMADFAERPSYKDLRDKAEVPDTTIGLSSDIFDGDPVFGQMTVQSVMLKYEGGNSGGSVGMTGENPFPALDQVAEAVREHIGK